MKTLLGFVVVALLAGLVPFGLIALARSQPSAQPPVHPIQDMYKQPKFRSAAGNPMFADGRAMRPLLPGVAARSDLQIGNELVNDADRPHMIDDSQKPLDLSDELTYQRVTEGTEPQPDGKPGYVKTFPVKVSHGLAPARPRAVRDQLRRLPRAGRLWRRHGGPPRGTRSRTPRATPPAGSRPRTSIPTTCASSPSARFTTRSPTVRGRMPAYGKQISVLDRWAIVAYVKALQRSQDAKAEDVPEAERDKYK